jgi:hypothetical protein
LIIFFRYFGEIEKFHSGVSVGKGRGSGSYERREERRRERQRRETEREGVRKREGEREEKVQTRMQVYISHSLFLSLPQTFLRLLVLPLKVSPQQRQRIS